MSSVVSEHARGVSNVRVNHAKVTKARDLGSSLGREFHASRPLIDKTLWVGQVGLSHRHAREDRLYLFGWRRLRWSILLDDTSQVIFDARYLKSDQSGHALQYLRISQNVLSQAVKLGLYPIEIGTQHEEVTAAKCAFAVLRDSHELFAFSFNSIRLRLLPLMACLPDDEAASSESESACNSWLGVADPAKHDHVADPLPKGRSIVQLEPVPSIPKPRIGQQPDGENDDGQQWPATIQELLHGIPHG